MAFLSVSVLLTFVSIALILQALQVQHLPGFFCGSNRPPQQFGQRRHFLYLLGVALGQNTFFKVYVVLQAYQYSGAQGTDLDEGRRKIPLIRYKYNRLNFQILKVYTTLHRLKGSAYQG